MRPTVRCGIALASGVAVLALGAFFNKVLDVSPLLALFPISLLVEAIPDIADRLDSQLLGTWLFSQDTYPLSFQLLVIASQIAVWTVITYLLLYGIERRRRRRPLNA